MSITADGWISWATRDPAPDWKHYDVDNERRGVIAHSMEGKYVHARARLFGPDRASWTGSILYSGELIEHYPVTYSVWASGSAEANIGFPAFETEGDKYEPFNDAQLATWARIIADLSAWAGWTLLRPVHPLAYGDPATLIEHRECKVLFDSSPTACPSERADWSRMMKMEETMSPFLCWDLDRGRVYLIGPFGAVWTPVQADADALAAKYGKVEMALHAATIDAFNR